MNLMTNPWPKISIVTPSLNQGAFLERTVCSVLDQDYPNLEYIVMDGGSQDESIGIIRKYESKLAYWTSQPDQGQSHAINCGMSKATGEIVAWLNSDDFYLPGTLKAVARAFKDAPAAAFVYGNAEFIEDGKVLDKKRGGVFHWEKELFQDQMNVSQPAAFFSAKLWHKIGGVREDLHYRMDYELFLRISQLGEAKYIDQTFARIEKHAQAKTVKCSMDCTRETFKVLKSLSVMDRETKCRAVAKSHYRFLNLFRRDCSWGEAARSFFAILYWDFRIADRKFLTFFADIFLRRLGVLS